MNKDKTLEGLREELIDNIQLAVRSHPGHNIPVDCNPAYNLALEAVDALIAKAQEHQREADAVKCDEQAKYYEGKHRSYRDFATASKLLAKAIRGTG